VVLFDHRGGWMSDPLVQVSSKNQFDPIPPSPFPPIE
jgi:hypothetical protein